MRYTEVRPAKVAHALLDCIDKNTVDFRENYDGSEQEPVVPPARYPNLLVNGSGRIAGGMATNIPPLGIVRQVHYSLANENSIDLVLFLNGLLASGDGGAEDGLHSERPLVPWTNTNLTASRLPGAGSNGQMCRRRKM